MKPQIPVVIAIILVTTSFNPLQKELKMSDLSQPVSIQPAAARPEMEYARCTGSTPCTACSNCKYCNWCKSGGNCGICTKTAKKKPTEKRFVQCQATTKKGRQCSRGAKGFGKYCWQHINKS